MRFMTKILLTAAGIIMTVSLVYGINKDSDNIFDEDNWRDSVSKIDNSLFYSPHVKDGEFFNPWLKMDQKGFFTVLKWRFFTDKPVYSIEEESSLPGVMPLTSEYINTHDNFLSWLGHASILIKVSGKVIIVDPVLGDIPFVKKRRTPAALTYDEAAKITGDITILLTHNHYDHLDKMSITSFPDNTKFIVPLGLSEEIHNMKGKNSNIQEIDWWNDVELNSINYFFTISTLVKKAFQRS